MEKKVVFILGPTGSGKTALAVELAKKFDGEIISADSRQIYTGLDIGSGKDLEEYGSVKYHLIDICLPEEKFTMFDWLKLARESVKDILNRGKLPIVVGGTGLYAKALAEGYRITKNLKAKTKKDGAAERQYSRDELNGMTLANLQAIYSKLPTPDSKLDINNPRRLIRAIEKAQEGTQVTKRKPGFESLLLAIDLPREEIYSRIDKRVDIRFSKQGMLEEVQNLIKDGVDPEWLKSLGLEYRFITMHLLGELGRKEMVQELKWKTHGYARRQLTWLRKQPGLIWIKNKSQAKRLVANLLK